MFLRNIYFYLCAYMNDQTPIICIFYQLLTYLIYFGKILASYCLNILIYMNLKKDMSAIGNDSILHFSSFIANRVFGRTLYSLH